MEKISAILIDIALSLIVCGLAYEAGAPAYVCVITFVASFSTMLCLYNYTAKIFEDVE